MSTAIEFTVTPQWTAIYRHPKYPKRQVVLNCAERPAKKREFHVPMAGSVVFTAVSITQLNEPKGGFQMAKAKTKRSKKKKKDEEEVEELEGLDDLEDEDDDEDEDEPDVEDEDEDEDEDDEDEDEDEEPPKKSKSKKSKGKGKKSKSKGKKRGPTGPRELPKGKYSAQDVAEMAGVDARAVRLFLRKKENKKKYPKDKELGRYAFTKKDATRIAKALEKDDEE